MLEDLANALSKAFTLESLERMVTYKLHKDLYDYAGRSNKQQVIFELLTAARQEGFFEEVIEGARAAVPKNPELLEFARRYGLESAGKSKQQLERIIQESHAFLDPDTLRLRIYEAERRVCRIEINSNKGMIYGTGFLVGPDLIMTNYHVAETLLADKDGVALPGGLKATAAAARVRFDYKRTNGGKVVNDGVVFPLAAGTSWFVDASPNQNSAEPPADRLDYAILRLNEAAAEKADSGGETRGYYQLSGAGPALQKDDTLFIMQHPRGAPLVLAMETKSVLGTNAGGTRVRYTTNTERGSSGSPCFATDWQVAALHHSGDPDFDPAHKPEYNEGIPMSAICTLLISHGHAAALGLN